MMKLYKSTALFTRTLFDRIALINDHWSHYPIIQRIESGTFKAPVLRHVPIVNDCYVNFPMNAINKICKFMEYNGPTNFVFLKQQGVDIHVYKKGEHFDTGSQAEPDNVVNMQNSSYIDKRIHGMDHKPYDNPPNRVDSRMFLQLSIEKYQKSLNNFGQLITFNLDLTKEQLINITTSLDRLAKSCENVVEHQNIWAEVMHYFPDKYIPPIRIPQNFTTQDLKPYFVDQLKASTIRMRKISDRLYELNVPENDYKKAMDYFEDSVIKTIMVE